MAQNYYNVIIKTGNVGGAGTDANVFIDLYGDAGRLMEQEIDNRGDDRERGDTDKYLLSTDEGSLGKICAVKLEHDDEGGGSGWYVDDVTVEDLGDNINGSPRATASFRFDRWLATDEKDGKTYATVGTPPEMSLIQPAMAYEGVRVGTSHAAIYTPSTKGEFTMKVSATSELTISESTENSETNSSETVVDAETSVSYVGVSARLRVTNTVGQELVEKARSSYTSADRAESVATQRYTYEPKDGQVVGVVFYEYKTIANGQVGFADRRFDFSHASTRWLLPSSEVFGEGSPELKAFRKKWAKYLS